MPLEVLGLHIAAPPELVVHAFAVQFENMSDAAALHGFTPVDVDGSVIRRLCRWGAASTRISRIPPLSESSPELCDRSIEGIRVAENDGGSTEHRSHPKAQRVATLQTGLFVRNGEYWTLGYGSTSFSLKDIKGLGYIQRLIQHPGEEFHSLDLLSSPGGGATAELESADKPSLLSDATVSIGGLGDAGDR